jgi:hypothetical protein
LEFGNYKPKKTLILPSFFLKSPFGERTIARGKTSVWWVFDFFFITASFGHWKKIGIKELLGSDIWGRKKKSKTHRFWVFVGKSISKNLQLYYFKKGPAKNW